jgi:hypothetical protein
MAVTESRLSRPVLLATIAGKLDSIAAISRKVRQAKARIV